MLPILMTRSHKNEQFKIQSGLSQPSLYMCQWRRIIESTQLYHQDPHGPAFMKMSKEKEGLSSREARYESHKLSLHIYVLS
jgi:hypothetical protein